MLTVLSGVLMITGALLAVIAGAGLQRFENVLSRMHAATKPATLGLALVLIGAAIQIPDPRSGVKLLLVILLQFSTAPVGAHLVGRAAYGAGPEMRGRIDVDELAMDRPEESSASG
ncbi:MAG: monovalent cation/H(+) antiporter subunit G [Actinobacteria bacterium]|nr:monovalent cation/H(+) antiporter subunit G [Actinomycetota bacterium]